MLRYALYARKSHDDAKLTEKSLGEQVSELRALAASEGLSIAREFTESKSAKVPGKRPLYQEMVKLVRQGKLDGILCWHVNRLARNMEEGGELVQLLIDGHIQEIRTPTETHRPGENIFRIVLEAASSTQYSLDLVRAVTRGLDGHAQSGGWNAKAPHGYRNARHPDNLRVGIIVPDPERFALIRKGWDMMLTGGYTCAQVAVALSGAFGYRGRPTKKHGGKPLTRSCAYKMFSNPFYAGYARYKGHLYKATHAPMVTEAEFHQVQQALENTLRQDGGSKRVFAYTGLMRCGHCASQITAEHHTLKDGKPYIFYRCADARGKCTKKGLAEPVVEAQVVKLLDSITIDQKLCEIAEENILRSLERQVEDAGVLYARQNRTLEEVEQKLSNLTLMWLEGLMTDKDRYKRMEAELQKERERLVLETARCRDELDAMWAAARHSCHFLRFARSRFLVSEAAQKREIARALATEYVLFGPERRIEIRLHPLLEEVVRFANTLERKDGLEMKVGQETEKTWNRAEEETLSQDTQGLKIEENGMEKEPIRHRFEPVIVGSGSRLSGQKLSLVSSGRTHDTDVDMNPDMKRELPARLLELLRTTYFPWLDFTEATHERPKFLSLGL